MALAKIISLAVPDVTQCNSEQLVYKLKKRPKGRLNFQRREANDPFLYSAPALSFRASILFDARLTLFGKIKKR